MSPEKSFTKEQKQAMETAIKMAEKETSGEIRVHIENQCPENILDYASDLFAELKMHKTEQRNGVLIYIALDDHCLAILGDVGINSRVPVDYWDSIKDRMIEQFKDGKITEGICEAIKNVGNNMKIYFPYLGKGSNELPDEISFG